MATISANIMTVTLSAGSAQKVASATDRIVAIVNIGTGRATLGNTSSVVDGVGYPLAPAASAGDQGGGISFTEGTTLANNLYAVSTVGTTLVVFEG